jgi:cytochrome oxidase Cu insertion factor (SCO1/SenC/PrrC family)
MKMSLLVGALLLGALVPRTPGTRSEEMLEIGKAAPTIRLNDHTGRATTLGSDKNGRWTVLAFFPKAATPG